MAVIQNRIREILKEKGLTQKDLEKATGLDQSHISRIINGKSVSLETAKVIAKALGYQIEQVWPD